MGTDISGSRAELTVSYPLTLKPFTDVVNVSGHRLSTAEIESALIMHKGVPESAGRLQISIPDAQYPTRVVIGTLTNRLDKPSTPSWPWNREYYPAPTPDRYSPADSEFAYDPNGESGLIKGLVLQVRKVIGPFAAPKKVYIVSDLPKTRSRKVRVAWRCIRWSWRMKIMCRIMSRERVISLVILALSPSLLRWMALRRGWQDCNELLLYFQ